MIDIYENLARRNMNTDRVGLSIDSESHMATFLLYNLSGQIVGYQRYNPNGSKTKNNDPVNGKYFTYAGIEGDRYRKIAVWGIDTLDGNRTLPLFITEGIFDANRIHVAGYPALAILSNNSKVLRSFFSALPMVTVAIMDRDKASEAMGKLTTAAFTVPEPYHDLDDMPQEEVVTFLGQIIQKITAKL